MNKRDVVDALKAELEPRMLAGESWHALIYERMDRSLAVCRSAYPDRNELWLRFLASPDRLRNQLRRKASRFSISIVEDVPPTYKIVSCSDGRLRDERLTYEYEYMVLDILNEWYDYFVWLEKPRQYCGAKA